jgi:hypothetical protein
MSSEACTIPNETINFTINIGIHIFILFCFVSSFFMIYISHLSQHSFENKIDELIEKGIYNGISKLPQENKEKLKVFLQGVPLDRLIKVYSKKSKIVEVNNDWLFMFIIFINLSLLGILTASTSILYVSCNQCVPIKDILIKNSVIFAIIGFVQFMFFKFVATKYIPVKPSIMITSTLESLKKHIDN